MLAVTPDVMQEEYGYTPAQVIDMKALMGDTSDNIPGVPGVGEKTALKLITEYGTVEGVYEHLDDISGKKLREKLADNKDKAMLSKELATINCHVPVEFDEAGFCPIRGRGKCVICSNSWAFAICSNVSPPLIGSRFWNKLKRR